MEYTGERALWRRVIFQVMCDALSNPKTPGQYHIQREAWQWLTRPNTEFLTVCEMAEMNQAQIRRELLERYAEGRGMDYKPAPNRAPYTVAKAVVKSRKRGKSYASGAANEIHV